jgi:tetratricopeptide (TPR) repeat protein
MGLFLAAATAADWLAQRSARRSWPMRWAYRAAFVWALVLLAAQTLVRNAVWSDPIALWQEASRRAPDHWLPYVPLGEALHAAGRHGQAAEALATALRLNPAETATRGKLGVCLIETGRLDEAQAIFAGMGRDDPASAESLYGLGLVALAHGQPAAARQYLLEVLARDTYNVPARLALARVAEAEGDLAGAAAYCEEIERLMPGGPAGAECRQRGRHQAPATP